MQNNGKCPIIPENEAEIEKMAFEWADNIKLEKDTLIESIEMLNTEFPSVACPASHKAREADAEPVVPEREGKTLTELSSKSILETRGGSREYGRIIPLGMRGGALSRMAMMEYMGSLGPSNESGEDAARNLTRLVKISILAIPTYLIIGGYFMNSLGYQTLSAGINAVFSGECTHLSSRIFSALGMGNPICDNYNSGMATIYRAMNLNGVDMAIIGSSFTLLLAAPALFNSFVDIITSVIAHSFKLARTMDISDETLQVLATKASSAWTEWTTLAANNSQITNLIPSQFALAAGIPQREQTPEPARDYDDDSVGPSHTRFDNDYQQSTSRQRSRPRPGRGGAKRKTRKSKRNSRKSKVGKRKTKRSNKKISRKTKHDRRKKARKTKKYN